jgi:hypothetical protein
MIDPDSVENKIVSRKSDGSLKRSETKLLIQSVLHGWVNAQDEYADEIRETLRQVMRDPDSRQRVDAAKAFAAMAGDTARVFEVVDKIERLDAGENTENIGINIIFEEDRGDRG